VPDIPDETREAWRARAQELSPADLHGELAARDPIMAERLPATDPQRLVRALEVIDATGISLADWQGTAGSPILRSDAALKLVVAPEREAVYAATDARLDRMVEEGALEEVGALMELQLDPGRPVMRALGVRELRAHLAGTVSLEDAVSQAKTESRRYAKRQMTWARRFMADWEWFPDGESAAAMTERAAV
jgi:tRNA dimethylallyltransferase